MRSTTQINQRSTTINSGGRLLNLLIQNANFELIVLEHLQEIFLLHLQTFKWLLILNSS